LDDYIDEDNPVRVIEAYIEKLDLAELGFKGVKPKDTGRPAYHPSALLIIYIWIPKSYSFKQTPRTRNST
jgi:transposase